MLQFQLIQGKDFTSTFLFKKAIPSLRRETNARILMFVIDILGEPGKARPTDNMQGVPPWLRGFQVRKLSFNLMDSLLISEFLEQLFFKMLS